MEDISDLFTPLPEVNLKKGVFIASITNRSITTIQRRIDRYKGKKMSSSSYEEISLIRIHYHSQGSYYSAL